MLHFKKNVGRKREMKQKGPSSSTLAMVAHRIDIHSNRKITSIIWKVLMKISSFLVF